MSLNLKSHGSKHYSCDARQEDNVMNYDVVIDMLSSEVQKPTLALIDSQCSDVTSVFQNITLSAMRYYL